MSGRDEAYPTPLPAAKGSSRGPLALHGGGECVPGDEPFVAALLALAALPALERDRGCLPARGVDPAARRVVIVPTAAARGQPDLAAANVARFMVGLADAASIAIRVETAAVVDAASAASAGHAARLAGADLSYLPGGDPDLIPRLLPGSLAWRGMLAARARGAVIAGASAGAMALGTWCWAPGGGQSGLGLASGVAVAPHFTSAVLRKRWLERFRAEVPAGVGVLGLPERTGVVELLDRTGSIGRRWKVVGPGRVAWYPPGSRVPAWDGEHGDVLALP